MDYSNYSNYDELFKIGDYKKLSELLKDSVNELNLTPKLHSDQVILLYYYFMARLELGKFSEVEKFFQSKLFKQRETKDNISQLFLFLIASVYSYEMELYSFNSIDFATLESIEKTSTTENFFQDKIALLCIHQSYLMYKKAEFDQFNKFYEKSTSYESKLDNSYYSAIYYLISSQINGLKGETSFSLSNAQNSYEKSISTKNLNLKAYSLLRIADLNFPRGQVQQSLENCENVFIIGKKLGNVKIMAMALFINAKICHHTMELDQSLELSHKAKDYFNNFNFMYGLMLLNNLIGNINHLKGELDQALKFFELALNQSEELDQFTKSIILNNIGNIYNDKGIFDSAIEYYNDALQISSVINYTWIKSIVLSNLGLSYHLKADYPKSIEYFTLSLKSSEEIIQPVHVAGTYFNLIVANIELNNISEVSKYFEKLRLLSGKDQNKLIYYYFELSRALIQKNKPGLNNFAESEEILKRLLRDNLPHEGLKQIVIINLADLMIKELTLQQSDDTFAELNNLIDKLYAYGREQNAFHLIIESLILKSKLTLIEGNMKHAERLLVQASILAEEKNLTYLVKKTDLVYNEFRKQVTHWAEIIENNTPLIEKLKLAEIQNYITDLQKMAFK